MRKIESNDIWKEEIEFKNLWILPKRLFCNYKNIRREIKIVLSSRAIVPLSVKKKSVASSTIFSAQFSPETELRLRRRKVIKTLFIQFFFFFFFYAEIGSHASERLILSIPPFTRMRVCFYGVLISQLKEGIIVGIILFPRNNMGQVRIAVNSYYKNPRIVQRVKRRSRFEVFANVP